MIRWTVCIDIQTDDPKEAYRSLHEFMDWIQNNTEFMGVWGGWESTNLAHDKDGNEIVPEDLEQAINEYFEEVGDDGPERESD